LGGELGLVDQVGALPGRQAESPGEHEGEQAEARQTAAAAPGP
jgi:hypothetical protein